MRLLLNEQINPTVAAELHKKGYDVVTPNDVGTRGASDGEQLVTAAAEHRALVTYNIGDFHDLLMEWSRKGLTHWGIIFVSERTISQRSIGPLIRALQQLLDDLPADDSLLNQSVHLRKG
ncbi:MAG: DUF5615 family PIN-like protein [Candidatus Methylomirabilales bacterium]